MLEGGMTKKPARAAKPAPAKAADGSGKRPKPKLALLALAPLLLAAGGYAGWTMFIAPTGSTVPEQAASDAAHRREGNGGLAPIPPEIAAETSYTHAFALSVLIAPRCGVARVPALTRATEAEAHENGMLVNLSWLAAARRAAATTEKSCDHLRAEVVDAERLAMKLADDEGKTAATH
jgi:hypothetical protein